MNYPLWFVDLENYEREDEISKMVETFLGLKEDTKQEQDNKEGYLALV